MERIEMTDEALAELNRKIAVMEASKTQKIQFREDHCGAWVAPIMDVGWDWTHYDYRVKPVEPRRIFVPALEGILYDNHFKNLVDLQKFARQLKYESHYSGYVEFVEVTHEVRAKLGL